MATSPSSKESLFGSLFTRLFHPSREPEPVPEAGAASRLETTERDLDSLLREVRDKVHEDASEEGGPGALGPGPSARRSAEEVALEEREAARVRLEQDIAGLHQSLGTGLEPGDLAALSTWLGAHAGALEVPSEGSLEERIDAQVLQELYLRAGRLAWERLEELMDGAGEPWPVPGDLALGRSREELERVLDQHRSEVEETFLGSPILALAGLVHGDIPAWSHFYPDSTSALWREVALRGVAAALRAELFRAMLDRWSERPADLEDRIATVLDGKLSQARTLVAGGVRTLDDARRVTGEVERACREVIPDMVWDFLGQALRRERNFPGAPCLARAGVTRKISLPGV